MKLASILISHLVLSLTSIGSPLYADSANIDKSKPSAGNTKPEHHARKGINQAEVAATPSIYKQVDARGNVSYSDTPPSSDAERLEMPPLDTLSMPKAPQYVPSKATAAPFRYESLSITTPADGSTFQNPSTPTQISAQVTPSLHSGHTVTLMLNGSTLTNNGLSAQVNHLDRGSHTLTAQVRDANGKVLITSAAVTIHVQRNTIKQPAVKQNAAPKGKK